MNAFKLWVNINWHICLRVTSVRIVFNQIQIVFFFYFLDRFAQTSSVFTVTWHAPFSRAANSCVHDEVSFEFVLKNSPFWSDRPISQIVSNFNQITVWGLNTFSIQIDYKIDYWCDLYCSKMLISVYPIRLDLRIKFLHEIAA